MKKIIFICVSALLLGSCSSKSNDTQSTTNESSSVQNDASGVSTEDIQERIENIYAETLTGSGGLFVLQKYCTSSFCDLYSKYEEASEGSIGSLDYDLWSQAQDVSEPKIEVKSVNVESSTTAKVKIALTNFGQTKTITLPLVLENGRWMIDDFVNTQHSARQLMEEDILAFGSADNTSESFDEQEESLSSYPLTENGCLAPLPMNDKKAYAFIPEGKPFDKNTKLFYLYFYKEEMFATALLTQERKKEIPDLSSFFKNDVLNFYGSHMKYFEKKDNDGYIFYAANSMDFAHVTYNIKPDLSVVKYISKKDEADNKTYVRYAAMDINLE